MISPSAKDSDRYIEGEPGYTFRYLPNYHAIPPVASIAPHEMHNNPSPTSGTRPSMMNQSQKPRHGDSEYTKRPRRRAEEVERLYACTWEGCDKAYGALNHLNTHVRNTNHGPKREPKGTELT